MCPRIRRTKYSSFLANPNPSGGEGVLYENNMSGRGHGRRRQRREGRDRMERQIATIWQELRDTSTGRFSKRTACHLGSSMLKSIVLLDFSTQCHQRLSPYSWQVWITTSQVSGMCTKTSPFMAGEGQEIGFTTIQSHTKTICPQQIW